MPTGKRQEVKTSLHPRNRNRKPYDLSALKITHPALAHHIRLNQYGNESVNFSDPAAVKCLNQAILCHYYNIQYWDFPDANLCPPIPGRADYLHVLADLLTQSNGGKRPPGAKINGLDVGVGASCIYPILGVVEYQWRFIGSDIDSKSLAVATKIAHENPNLKNKIDCRLQNNKKKIFTGILRQDEYIDFSMCNPPFHASKKDALKGTQRKLRNLTGKKTGKTTLNFAGVSNELICEGGELGFLQNMIAESKQQAQNCFWFTSLVAKREHLKAIYTALKKAKATAVKTLPMGTGNKATRIVAWTFLTPKEQQQWKANRWSS